MVHSICNLCRILPVLFRGGHQSYTRILLFLSPLILILKAQIISIHSFITFLKLFFFNTESSAFLLLCCLVSCIIYIFLQLLPTPLPTIYFFPVFMHIPHFTSTAPNKIHNSSWNNYVFHLVGDVDFSVSKSNKNRDNDVVYLVTWHPFMSAVGFLRSMAESLIKNVIYW